MLLRLQGKLVKREAELSIANREMGHMSKQLDQLTHYNVQLEMQLQQLGGSGVAQLDCNPTHVTQPRGGDGDVGAGGGKRTLGDAALTGQGARGAGGPRPLKRHASNASHGGASASPASQAAAAAAAATDWKEGGQLHGQLKLPPAEATQGESASGGGVTPPLSMQRRSLGLGGDPANSLPEEPPNVLMEAKGRTNTGEQVG